MLPAEIVLKKNAELIAYLKEELKEKCPTDVEELERPVLIELVKGIVGIKLAAEEDAKNAEETQTQKPKEEEKSESPADNIQTAQDAVDALKIMGFESKEQVKAYLKGVEREKEQSKLRMDTIERAHADLDQREVKLKKREADIDAKGKQVLEDLLELRKVRENNAQLLKQREALSKL